MLSQNKMEEGLGVELSERMLAKYSQGSIFSTDPKEINKENRKSSVGEDIYS